jgi:hypothetical protein
MQPYRVETVISQEGRLELSALPFQAGEVVEVIILPRRTQVNHKNRYPLAGKVLKYDHPTEPVAQEDWIASCPSMN